MTEPTKTPDREQRRMDNRAQYPEIAAWIDEFRRVFGAEQVRVIGLRRLSPTENGNPT